MTPEQEERMVAAYEGMAQALTGVRQALIAIAQDMKDEPAISREARLRFNWRQLKKEILGAKETDGPLEEIPETMPTEFTE
jgi:predicted GIY-YIG superfamily endonuclease